MKKQIYAPKEHKLNWAPEKLELLKKLYPTTHNEEVAKAVGKPVNTMRSMAFKLKLKKNNRYWQMAHEKFIVKQWPVMTPDEIAAAMFKKYGVEKTRWAIINKYRELMGKR